TICPFLIPLDSEDAAPMIFIEVSIVTGSVATCEINVAILLEPNSIPAIILDLVIYLLS
ncbi:MAG: hypothetical protein GYA62_15380, partial [Bacteroidales bacterium]|nr:hypothetical protein [Bacteroidales bacterium]